MRLSDWQKTAQGKKVMTTKVADAYEPALRGVGAIRDPMAYVLWGDDPATRYVIFAATDAGLAICNVRVNVPQEGPRASARLVRWQRVAIGDLSVDAHHGHRYVATQVEGVVLRGVDDDADQITQWVSHLFARIDGHASLDHVSGLLGPGSGPVGDAGGGKGAG
ncbi:MAG: hypothetical protein ACHQZR_04700 [Candidatus Limnocylindrales bacterium]